MMTAEHRRPLAAFLMVFAVACVIIGNGLRTQVVEVLIGSGAPQEVITAVAPDMLLGEALRRAPKSQPAPTPPRAEATDEASADVASADVATLVDPVPQSVTLAQSPARDRSTGDPAGSRSNDQSGASPVAVPPTAPVVVTPPSAPVPPTKPEPGLGRTPTPGKRPWQPVVSLVPMLFQDPTSPDDGEGHRSVGWGNGHSHIDDGQHGLIKRVVTGLVRDEDGDEFRDRSTDKVGVRSTDKSRGNRDEAKPRSRLQTSGHDHSDARPATARQSDPRGDRRRFAEQRDRSRRQRATSSTPAAPPAVAPIPHNRQPGHTRTQTRHESRHDSRAATRNESPTESRGRDDSDRGNRARSGHGR
jgi:hypothetical protein